jgi:hypothetical protein
MAEEFAALLKKVMALPKAEREALVSSLRVSLGEEPAEEEVVWASGHRKTAMAGLKRTGRVGFMEASFHVAGGLPRKPQAELLRAVEKAAIHAFGWPIGVVLHTEKRPRPISDGIVAEIGGIDFSYDYWALRTNGDFFFLGSLFEDERTKDAIWFDTRIMRVTETFLFCYRLYKALGATEETSVNVALRHGGLRDRTLGSARPALWAPSRISLEDEVEWSQDLQLVSLRDELKQTLKGALDSLWILFDFFEPPDQQVYSVVDQFLTMVERQQKPYEL